MQDLYARAKADNRRILNTGFHAPITFTHPATGEQQVVEGFNIDVPLDINPQSGMPIRARKIAAQIHASDLTIGNPVTVAGEWRVSFISNNGEAIDGLLETPDYDRTLDMLSFRVKLVKVLPPTPPEAP
jgi:hypothetical protein